MLWDKSNFFLETKMFDKFRYLTVRIFDSDRSWEFLKTRIPIDFKSEFQEELINGWRTLDFEMFII